MTSLLHRTAGKGVSFAIAALFVLVCVMSAQAQQTTGNVRGIVQDPNGASIANAQVTITNPQTNTSQTVQTTGSGDFQFSNLEPADYTVTVEAANFSKLSLTNVRVELNQTTDLPARLQVGAVGDATVEVNAGGAELVDTTSNTLASNFTERQVVDLAQTSIGSGVNNLALVAPGVSSSGGVGVGTGGSVGGQRPRNNNFVLDGVDNNDKSVTGPQVYVSPEVVNQFSLLQNQFSAEFVRSNGGQFITVTKSGTNDFHGSVYGFFRNRYLNALDTQQKISGVVRSRSDNAANGTLAFPRSDNGRFGFNIGGPFIIPRSGENGAPAYALLKDRLFFFTSYERLQSGSAASAGGFITPTAAGLSLINSTPGLSPTNLRIFNQFVPIASTNNAGTISIAGRAIPVGNIAFAAPSFFKQNYFVINIDGTQSERTQHRGRFSFVNGAGSDTAASLPFFFQTNPSKQRLFSYTLTHSLSGNFTNETRLSYRRTDQFTAIPNNLSFPGLDVFPNVGIADLGGLNIGPDPNAPQGNIENNYQVVNQSTYLAGSNTFKFGGDYRRIISPQVFVQRGRGDYEYETTERFLLDLNPEFAERNVGAAPYAGNQQIFFAFLQDDYRVRPNVTLNLGVNYSYQSVPRGAQEQSRNAIASVPGFLEFNAPRAQKKNFAPKVGIAYAPNFTSGLLGSVFGASGKSSIRAGFSLGYDYIFDNLYILSNPPQAQQTIDFAPTTDVSNFLANGGIPNVVTATNTPAGARSVTGSFIPDQKVPYSITYSLSFQRQFAKDYGIEVRYLGTRGVHLLTQNRINVRARVDPALGGGLPTFVGAAPAAGQPTGLTTTLGDINARSRLVPSFAANGFTSNVVGFLSNGNSIYHGGSVQLTRRFTGGLQGTAAYTYSHLIDDSTAEVFSTVLSPRRAQDFQNIRSERSDSALDHRHRFVTSAIYELPFFRKSENKVLRTVLGGFSFAGTYSAESGEKATVRSGIDSNLNGDNAGDRTVLNVNGVKNTGSIVAPIDRNGNILVTRNAAGGITGLASNNAATVAYITNFSITTATGTVIRGNPNAQFIQAGLGAVANSGRNNLQLPGINNLDFSIFKNFRFGETRRIQLRADMFNAFNHPQYIPGSPNDVQPISTAGIAGVNTVSAFTVNNGNGGGLFNNPSAVFSSNPRVIQLALRFDF